MRHLHALPVLALGLVGALFAGPDPASLLPSGLPLTGRIDLGAFTASFPNLARTGLVGEKLDELATKGFPDPRSTVSAVAFGATLGKAGLEQGVGVAACSTEVLPQIRRVAGEKGLTLADEAVRGITFVTASVKGKSSRFADLAEGTALAAFDRSGAYALARAVVDRLAGKGDPAFAASLAAGTWLEVTMKFDDETRDAIGESPLHHLAHLVAGSLTLKKTALGARLELKAECTGSIKARLGAFGLSSKISSLAESATDPAVKKVLSATKVDRDGAVILVTAEASVADLEAAALAAQGLVKAKVDAKRAAAAK